LCLKVEEIAQGDGAGEAENPGAWALPGWNSMARGASKAMVETSVSNPMGVCCYKPVNVALSGGLGLRAEGDGTWVGPKKGWPKKRPQTKVRGRVERERRIDVRTSLLLRGFAGLVSNPQVVFYRKDSGDAIGADVGGILVGLGVDHAVQLNMAILHENADGLGWIDGVLVEAGITVDGAILCEADAVIHGRRRIDLDLVDHIFDARTGADQGQCGIPAG